MNPTDTKPKTGTLILRKQGTENIARPQYAKWAAMLTEGKPIRLITSHERVICFIPSSVFPDNGGMPIGTLMITYVGPLFTGVVELDFTKKPNPFFLKMSGFPITIGTLICQTIYRMFPHLNPLSEADQATLSGASKKTKKTAKVLAITGRKQRPKKDKTEAQPAKTELVFKPEVTVEPPQAEPPAQPEPQQQPTVIETEATIVPPSIEEQKPQTKTDHDCSSKQQKTRKPRKRNKARSAKPRSKARSKK